MIREYRAADCEDVLSVWARASAVAHPFLSAEFLAHERHDIAHVYLPQAETWVWSADGHVVGFISLLGSEIGAIFVAPECQRAGIGRALVDHARALHGDLEVEVFERNPLGRAFYAKLGFEFMHETVHEPTGHALLRLRLRADPALQPMRGAGG